MLYGGVTSGFKAGGIQTTSDGISRYDEEQLFSYEVGFKSSLAGGAYASMDPRLITTIRICRSLHL
jgi:hypothetical protein